MSNEELDVTKFLIKRFRRQSVHPALIMDFVLDFWVLRMSIIIDIFHGVCVRYDDALKAYKTCQRFVSLDLAAIIAARNANVVNMEYLETNFSCSIEESMAMYDFVTNLYNVEFQPLVLEIKRIRWFIIYKLLNNHSCRKQGWEKLENAMKGRNKELIFRVKRTDRF